MIYQKGQVIKGTNTKGEKETLIIVNPKSNVEVEFYIIGPSVRNPQMSRKMPEYALTNYIRTLSHTDFRPWGKKPVTTNNGHKLIRIGA